MSSVVIASRLSAWPNPVLGAGYRLTSSYDLGKLRSRQMRSGLAGELALLGVRVGSGWRIESVIGVGGSATVFRAEKPGGELAAVKLMRHQLATAWSKRFEREAKLLQSLSHPAIPRLYEFGRLRGVPFLVIEHLSGRSLDAIFRDTLAPPRVSEIVAHGVQALEALSAVHEHGIVHRDLKPSNLFLTEAGALKVLDFGAAADIEAPVPGPDSLTSGLLGTPAYMSPEQARGRWDMVDRRSDIWSLGAVLFTLFSGQHVHPAQTQNEQLSFAMTRSARSLASVAPSLDPNLVRAIDRALQYRRADRFQSVEAFRRALLGSFADVSVAAPEQLDTTLRETGSLLTGGQLADGLRAESSFGWRTTATLAGAALGIVALATMFSRSIGNLAAAPSHATNANSPAADLPKPPAVVLSPEAANITPTATLPALTVAAGGRAGSEQVHSRGFGPTTRLPRPLPRSSAEAQAPRAPLPSEPPTAVVEPSALDRRLRADRSNTASFPVTQQSGESAASPLDVRR